MLAAAARRPLILGALIFLVILLLSTTSYHYRESLPSISVPGVHWSSNSSTTASIAPQAPECRQLMMLPGYIDDAAKAWKSTTHCTNTVSFADLPSLKERLRDKTFYFYGDSVIRLAMTNFCTMIEAADATIPDPEGYWVDGDQQRIHTCTLADYNFNAVNTYHFGMHEFNQSSDVDKWFVHGHKSFADKPGQDFKASWQFEPRMKIPHDVLMAKVGPAHAVFLGTGAWDLAYLHQEVIRADVRDNIAQIEGVPEYFLAEYKERLRSYIRLAKELHPDARVYFNTFHDPRDFNQYPAWGLEGFPEEWKKKPKFSSLGERRVQEIRNAQIVVAKEEGGVTLLPYEIWVRSVRREARMRDNVHPSEETNRYWGLGMLGMIEGPRDDGVCPDGELC